MPSIEKKPLWNNPEIEVRINGLRGEVTIEEAKGAKVSFDVDKSKVKSLKGKFKRVIRKIVNDLNSPGAKKREGAKETSGTATIYNEPQGSIDLDKDNDIKIEGDREGVTISQDGKEIKAKIDGKPEKARELQDSWNKIVDKIEDNL